MSRSVAATAEQIVVTSGAQQAIDLVARILVTPGQSVAVEEPGYPPVTRLLSSVGLKVEPVPVDAEGIIVDQIPARARLVYTTPSHQYPTGVTMSRTRRHQLLDFADRHGTAIIEDDDDSEYCHADRPLEPLHRLDRSGRVIYVATFSKTLAPSLRLGFAVLPPSLVDAVVGLRSVVDWQPPAVSQIALGRFIADGHLRRHLRRTRKTYQQRHRILTEFVHHATTLNRLEHSPPNLAGLHVTARLPDDANEAEVRTRARALA